MFVGQVVITALCGMHKKNDIAVDADIPHTCSAQFSITHSLFHSKRKTFLFCKSFPLQPFLFFFRTDYMIPQTFTVTSEHIRFYFFSFSVLHF